MTGLFSFDGPLYRDKNKIYCSVTLTDEMFSRYFAVVDKLVIMVRTYTSDKTYQELNMKPLTLDNIEVIEVDNLNSPKGYLIDKVVFEKRLPNLLKNVDMIFARMPSNISNVVLKFALKIHKPYLVEVGGDAWDSFWNHSIMGKIVAPSMYANEKKYVAKADFATYVTEEYLQKRYPNHNKTTNCSNVYLEPMEENVLRERLNRIENMDSQHIVFGQALHLIDVRYKGAHLFVKAMGKLKEKGIIVEYQLVGDGTGNFIKKQAEKYGVSEQIKYLGILKKEEIFEWLKQIDVYVQPSKQEGLPRSVIEAMSTGSAAIGSNIAGIPELLDKECLFDPDKNEEIVAAVERMFDKKELSRQSKRNFEKAKKYNIEDIEKRRRKIFEEYRDCVLKNT